MSFNVFTPRSTDFHELLITLEAAAYKGGCVRLPAGDYHVPHQIALSPHRSLSIMGEGEGVTRLIFGACGGLRCAFRQEGAQQPHGLTMQGVSLTARGSCGTGLTLTYGNPGVTNDHYRPSLRLSNVVVESGTDGQWANGIDIADAWNATLDNVFVSGSSANGVWNNLSGTGINFQRMTVNAHLTNVRTNFWATGIRAHADTEFNTEGLFFSNCSMVGVKRGLWVKGNPKKYPHRISTVNWMGGMIEARVGGVVGGSAAFHLENVHTALIHGCQMLTETITENVEKTYGVIAQDCHGIVVTGCDINSWSVGVQTTGRCQDITTDNNTYVNCAVARA